MILIFQYSDAVLKLSFDKSSSNGGFITVMDDDGMFNISSKINFLLGEPLPNIILNSFKNNDLFLVLLFNLLFYKWMF